MYSPQQIREILAEKDVVVSKATELLGEYLALSPTLPQKAQEHCQHGIGRRLFVINECLEYFFSEMPPDTSKERSPREQSRANIHLHAFLINVSGIIDNMAWLWAYHIGLQDRIDLEKKKTMIGLFNKDFSEHLPERVTALADQYSDWHEFMVNHRHPTAHRIPPYVIPYTNSDEKDSPDSRDYTPRYVHSVSSKYGLIALHAQSLVDTKTVLSLLEALLAEVKAEHV